MLSRIAESLFWIGRYIERAEATARFLDVHLRLLVEDPWTSEPDACGDLLSLMGVSSEEPSRDELIRLLSDDPSSPASIVSCWRFARDNARRAREVIPSEVWEVINTTWHQVPADRRDRRVSFYEWARGRSALFSGTARGSMVHDDGWQFLIMGRHLEQADMTSRLVAAASLVETNPWPAVLRGCGAHDAFLRMYRGVQADREVAEFLLLDQRFPRSIMYGLDGVERSLEMVTPAERTSAGRRHEAHDALHRIGKLRADLTYTPMLEILEHLNDRMADVQSTCDSVTKIISSSFFSVDDLTAWTTEGTR
ncbi:alpha-E domain-containing protein [Propionibacteriaceae bacterium Y1685]